MKASNSAGIDLISVGEPDNEILNFNESDTAFSAPMSSMS